jgi:hypothetical protein
VNTRFSVDLLHPGWVTETWRNWFIGPRGWRRLALPAMGGAAVLLLLLGLLVLPSYRRLSRDLAAVPGLNRELAAKNADLGLLRSNFESLSQEARRQVRWADVLAALSREMPSALRLQLVEAGRTPVPATAGQGAGAPGRAEETLRIEALTPARAGSPPLVDVAQFLAALMRDPAVNRRFALKSWEIKPSALLTSSGEQLLTIAIVLTERAQ